MLDRLKFDIVLLVEEMLIKLPKWMWTSKTTTFLDPSIGGGQFAAVVETRLRKAGHSDANIAKRVFGYADDVLELNYAIKRWGLVGTYKVGSFLEEKMNKKFDVVLGNPPYQSGKGEKGGSSSLWRKFVSKGWDLTKDDGRLMFVVPQLPNSSKDLGEIFYAHQTEIVWDDIAHHFSGVGSSFYAWMVLKAPKTKQTHFINKNLYIDITNESLPKHIEALPIVEKVMKGRELFECKSSGNYFHTQVADGADDDYLSSQKSKSLKYKLRRTSGNNYAMWGAEEPEEYTERKVCFTFSGYPYYQYHDEKDPIGTIKFQSGHILVKNKKEAKNLISLYESCVYRFIMDEMTPGGMRGKRIYELPKMDLSRAWTDKELYKHFGLTDEEIAYIEEAVK